MKKILLLRYLLLFFFFIHGLSCERDPNPEPSGKIQLFSARIGQINLQPGSIATVEQGQDIVVNFTLAVDPQTLFAISLEETQSQTLLNLNISTADNNKQLVIKPDPSITEDKAYRLELSQELKGAEGESFDGVFFEFKTLQSPLEILNIFIDEEDIISSGINQDINRNMNVRVELSHDVQEEILQDEVLLIGKANYELNVSKLSEAMYQISPVSTLPDYTIMNLIFPSGIGSKAGRPFDNKVYKLFTELDSTPDFPQLSDEDLLTLIQEQTFKYFWDFGHSNSGMARERNTSGNTVTSGGSGFGIMAMIVAVERGFITRDAALDRWEKILSFLETADRFHGVWSHWINGDTGKVRPFSQKDNGGDLVETAFLIQGLLTVRQYLDPLNSREELMINRINALWESVEWEWYTKGGEKVLYWHWSPEYNWDMNHRIQGHNETQIVYILAAASPTFTIDRQSYENGYARNGNMKNGNEYYSIPLPLGFDKGGPLFFTHYSYLGLDPRNLADQYANYWEQNVAHTRINRMHCIDNPGSFLAYSQDCWGLTASDNHDGYSAHSPTNDLGVITPTAAISSIPYTPEESMDAIKHFYYILGDRLWGEYGFYDAFNFNEGWVADSYLAIDQGPIICMIENHRTALLWDLFMSAPEIQNGLDKLGFNY